MQDLKIQLKAKHAIEDDERAEGGGARSRAQKEHQEVEDYKCLPDVYNSTVYKHTSFDFVKIRHMLHYEESIQRFGHLVNDSTETQEMNHSKMCMGAYRWLICYFRYEWQILNHNSRIHFLPMQFLDLPQLAKQSHWSPKIQESLQLYRPKDQIVINKCNREQLPITEDLPLNYREDEGNIQSCGLQSPRRRGFFGKKEHLSMNNFPLGEYLYRCYRYGLDLPTMDRLRGISGMDATQFNVRDVPAATFQSFGVFDSTSHELCRMDDQSFRKTEPRNDFVWFRADELQNGDQGDLWLAQLVRILQLQDGLWKRCIVLLQELQLENQGVCQHSSGLLRVSDKVFGWNQANLVVVNVKWVWAATCLICIASIKYYYVNNTIDLVMFNHFWPSPLEAEADMQTDNDAARPEEYCRHQIASVDENEEDK